MYIASLKIPESLTSLTANTEVATFEASNLVTPLGSHRWRSSGSSDSVRGALDQTREVQLWGVLYNNAQSGDTVRLRLADSEFNLTAAPALDTGTLPAWPGTGDLSAWAYIHTLKRIATVDQVSASWFRIDFSFSAPYVEGGVLVLADSTTLFSPALSQERGFGMNDENRTAYEVDYTAGGQGRGGGGTKSNFELSVLGISRLQALGVLKPLLRDRQQVKPVVCNLDENEATYPMDYIAYGYMNRPEFVDTEFGFELRTGVVEP